MRYRRYSLDIPVDIDKRLKEALAEVKKRGLLPEATTERDFLLATVFTNGLAMVEADLKNRERATRSVLLPEEVTEWPAKKPLPSGFPNSGMIAKK